MTLKLAFVILFEVSIDDFIASLTNFNLSSILESTTLYAYLTLSTMHAYLEKGLETDCKEILPAYNSKSQTSSQPTIGVGYVYAADY